MPQAALEKAGANFPNLLDADGKAFAQVGSERLPRTYLLDPQGKILWFDIEYSLATRRELHQALRAVDWRNRNDVAGLCEADSSRASGHRLRLQSQLPWKKPKSRSSAWARSGRASPSCCSTTAIAPRATPAARCGSKRRSSAI